MAQSIRVLYRAQQGTIRKNFNWAPISLDSAVVITAAEFSPAKVYVTNVGPHGIAGIESGGVEFLLHVDWDSPLDIVATITVHEPIEEFFQA
jgi:hypothetical protein